VQGEGGLGLSFRGLARASTPLTPSLSPVTGGEGETCCGRGPGSGAAGEGCYSHPLFRNHLSMVNAITMQTPQKIGYEIAYLFSGIGMFIP